MFKNMEKLKSIAMYVLAGLIVVCFFVTLGLLVFKTIPTENKDLFNLAMGTELAGMATIVGYFYGSSMGSKEKTDLLNKKE
jgi:hypothetical protein